MVMEWILMIIGTMIWPAVIAAAVIMFRPSKFK